MNTKKTFCLSDGIDFSLGVRTGITKSTIGSGKELLSFAANAITHPIGTTYGIYEAFSNLAKLACSQEWGALSKALAPEICTLVNEWKTLSAKEKGEKSGYILGKYGTDIFLPGAAAKVISKGMKGAKELAVIARNLQKTEKLIVMEAFAGGGGAGAFSEVLCKTKTAEQFLPHSSRIFNNLKKVSRINTKTDILKIMKPNGIWMGKEGARSYIRLFEGGQNEAIKVFKKLTKDAKLINNNYPGKMYVLQDGSKIGFRPLSKSGPPTIDLDIIGYGNNIKIKFMDK